MSYENIPKNADETAVLTESRTNWELEVVAGRMPNMSVVHVFGRNPNISPADDFVPVWSGGGDYTGFNATAAELVTIVSDSADDTAAGIGARTILFEGLDINYNIVSEVVVLNGLTPVDTVNTYLRWKITFVLSAGSNGRNVGAITGGQKLTPANQFFHMVPESNRVLAAIVTVPAGVLYYTRNRFATLAKKGNASSEVQVIARIPGTVFQVFEWFAIDGAGSSYVNIGFDLPLIGIPAGADVYIAMNTDTNNSGVAAGVEFIVESV